MAVGMALEMDVAKRLFFKKNKINKIKKKEKHDDGFACLSTQLRKKLKIRTVA